ncbi:hypothetical protein [Arenimonas terrae]|uniref:Dicarboxylate transport domain-containing protein n=1 Tax=Arenimonas terrae TaxID=2546226 RepID=A0A5C4RW75_9GAMM|nr:hypothetical protein [Arenimonas terrae]TNJ34937.1 hypothetical protein E1B00_03935 [Arenimonas terrae]
MRRPDTLGKTLLWALLLIAAGPLPAAVLRAEVDAVRSGVGTLEQVEVRLAWAEGASEGQLELRAASLDFPLLSYRARDIAWSCPLRRAPTGEWACAGPLAVRGARAPGSLSLAISPAETAADLALGRQRISYRNLAAAPDLSRIRVEQIPIAWLQAYLASLWAEGQWTQGQLSGQIDVAAPADGPFQVTTDLRLSGLGLETPDGWLAAAGLGGRLRLDYTERGADARVSTIFDARGGEFLAQGLYALLPDSPVTVQVEAERRGDAPWRLPRFAWTDGQVLRAEGQARLDAEASVQQLDLALTLGDLAVARDRYLSGFLAPAGFGDLVLSGRADARLQLRDGELQAMALDLDGVNAVDPRQRFILAGLQGGLRWTGAAQAVASQLRWTSGALYGIGVGPARFDLDSSDGELRLREPAALAMLEGQARLDQFRWQAPRAGKGTRFQIGATLTDLDLGSLSQRLGWPPFTGSLGGRIPSARYEGGVLTLDGGLAMQVFGGSVSLSELVMERPFGIAPTLSADIAIEDIDMEPMTAAFGFGAITGRLDGRIANLRMVDWSPVAFDARLLTDPAWKGKRRISQRAVEDISKVGGAGLVAGLQTQVLKLFDDFGYARIGLGCRLRDNVCAMEGVSSAGDGYTIVEGSGLPRIQVVGFRRRVDWPTLVDRLEAATAGQAPVIQ